MLTDAFANAYVCFLTAMRALKLKGFSFHDIIHKLLRVQFIDCHSGFGHEVSYLVAALYSSVKVHEESLAP